MSTRTSRTRYLKAPGLDLSALADIPEGPDPEEQEHPIFLDAAIDILRDNGSEEALALAEEFEASLKELEARLDAETPKTADPKP